MTKFKPNQEVYAIGYSMICEHVVCATTFVKYLPVEEQNAGTNFDGTTYLQDCITADRGGMKRIDCSEGLWDNYDDALAYCISKYGQG